MKQVLFDKDGRVMVKEVPVPHCGRDQVLVKVRNSLVSAGTEMSMIGLMKKPLVQMAIERRDLAKQVIDYAREAGIKSTIDLVKSRLDVWHELGYSCSGVVEKAGENAQGFQKGDRVACLGSGFANHAEYVAVPKTLLVKLPKGLAFEQAAWGGVGAIAMESVRQLDPKIGETHAVIGLGLIGDLVAQILKANGCRVIGIDIDEKKTDAAHIDHPMSVPDAKAVQRMGGADGVIIAASSKNNLTNIAFDMCRRRGRVVMLGVTGMDIDRSKMYEKELELKMSTAFGPGYYDPEYEVKGRDYPVSYVRWTAGRNMQAFLSLVSESRITLPVSETFPIEKAQEAYASRKGPVMFGYKSGLPHTSVNVNPTRKKGIINAGLIGAGNFTRGFIIPNLSSDFRIMAVATRDGSRAKHIAEQLKARYATTDYTRILADRNIDLVIIGTRHDSHAEIALAAIKAGKHVFVEKPLAIYEDELEALRKALQGHKKLFAAGFNRRYAPMMVKLKEMLGRKAPLMISYVFNNPELPPDHWVNQRDVGGGRFIGEACHIMDLFNFLTGAKPVAIHGAGISSDSSGIIPGNNRAVTMKYDDGSVCSLVYTCMGNTGVGKERLTVFDGGNVYEVSNFQSLTKNGVRKYSSSKDEGHAAEFDELRKAMTGRANSLITAEDSVLAMRMTFEAMR
jgi:predicted dehydrogenase/threonine dehydrogenase-like Zn-dependent dehydrogenase